MANEWKLKQEICEIGRRLYNKGFAAANDGNITVRLNDKEVLCTPTMVSKGFMKPEDVCKVDYNGKQLAGSKRRTSEVLLHLTAYKARPDVNAVVHCHPPHATAFAVAHEPIPKCILPEVEVFLGEVPIAVYETPGTQRFGDTILPYVKECNTILLANHGTVTFGPTLENAYFNSEIIDAYCKILILTKQLGRVNYFTPQQTQELLEFKKRLGYDDPRLKYENCDLCSNNLIRPGYKDFEPEPLAFARQVSGGCQSPGAEQQSAISGQQSAISGNGAAPSVDELVRTITDQIMAAV